MSVRVDMVGLVVKNMAASIRFYRELGLPIPDPDEGGYHEITLDGGIRLSFNTEELMREIDPEWVAPVGQRIALAFRCETPDAVNDLFAELVAAGYQGHRAPWDAFWGQRYAQVLDPDGMLVDLFCPLPA